MLAVELTDLADGFFARRLGATSKLGALADPLADKAFNVAVAWQAFRAGTLPPWFFQWLAILYAVTMAAYGIDLLIRRPAKGRRVPKPHPIGRGAGFVCATAVIMAICPWSPVWPWAIPVAGMGVGLTALHLALTIVRLLQRKQEY